VIGTMKEIKKYPPNFKKLEKAFGTLPSTTVFSYGHKIYNPSGKEMPDHLIEHEQAHATRQLEIGVRVWWKKYIEYKDFRLNEEVIAFRVQYQYILANAPRRDRMAFLHKFATSLSSSMYGNMVSKKEALDLISK